MKPADPTWPFLPESLQEAVDSRSLKMFIAGLSSTVGFPAVAVDVKSVSPAPGDDSGTLEVHRPSREETQCWNPFCRLLRSESMMGFHHCTEPELKKVGAVAAKLDAPGAKNSYKCEYGLTNYVFPISVDEKYPIGYLVAGQLALSDEDKDLGLETIGQLPLSDSQKEKLGELLIGAEVPSDDELQEKLEALRINAGFLAAHVTQRAQKLQSEKELELLRSGSKQISTYAGKDISAIHAQLGGVLEAIRDFCGFERVIALLSRPGSDNNILRFAASSSQVSEDVEVMHYNWRKGGVRSADRHRYLSSTNIGIIEKGLKNVPQDFLENLSGFIAYSMAAGPKGLMLAEGNSRALRLEEFRPFFDSLAKNILRTVLSDIQGIALREMVETYAEQMTNGSHHMLDALTNSQFTLGYLQKRIERGDAPADLLRKRLALIERDIDGALNVTKRTLSWERGVPGKDYDLRACSLVNILDESVGVKLEYARHRRVRIDVSPKVAELPKVWVDEEMIRMAFNCILDNAVKYSHPDKSIYIDARVEGGHSIVSIEDFGLGISDDETKKIYDYEFYSRRRGKSKDQPMHGIGLAFAADVIHSHEGQIWHRQRTGARGADSKRLEGYKVTFYVKLPLHRGEK